MGLSTLVAKAYGAPAKTPGGCYRNAQDVPREALVVQLRRMRFALLGRQAGSVDKRQDARTDTTTHSVPIAEMGNFHEVLRRREAEGASPLRDPHLDKDDEERRRRMQFGNPFRKGDRQAIMMSDEIEAGEASAGGKQRERRRGRRRGMARRTASSSGSDAGSSIYDSDSSRECSPAPSSLPDVSEEMEHVAAENKWEVKLAMLKLVRGRAPQAQALLRRAACLQGEEALIGQVAEFARALRKPDLARLLDAIAEAGPS